MHYGIVMHIHVTTHQRLPPHSMSTCYPADTVTQHRRAGTACYPVTALRAYPVPSGRVAPQVCSHESTASIWTERAFERVACSVVVVAAAAPFIQLLAYK